MSSLRWIGVLVLLIGSSALLQCGGQGEGSAALPSNPDEDFETTMDAYVDTENPEEKAALWLAFLERNPSTGYTVGALQYLATEYYMGLKKNPDAAISLVKIKLSHLRDPALNAEGQRLLIELLGDAGRSQELTKLVRRLQTEFEFGIADEESVYSAAIAAENWELALEFSQAAARRLAADLEDSKLSEEDVESVETQRSAALASQAWAKSNLGENEEALKLFQEAEKIAQFDYTGFSAWPTQEFDLYYGKALMRTGKVKEAITRLGPQGVILGDAAALEVLQEAYRADTGSSDGFQEFVEETRRRIARKLPDFKAFDYEGNKVESAGLMGRATLLAFWFPT